MAAWPEYFSMPGDEDENAVPTPGADLSKFEWEDATQESAEADLEMLMALNETVSVADPELQVTRPPLTGDLEWT
jgi:hypothetical protein